MMSVYGRNTVSAYASAKGGLKLLTANMCCEWAKYNVQINGIGPGYIATAQTAIDAAKVAVKVQTGREYNMNIVDDATLKQNAALTSTQFRQDLMAAYNLVLNAKQAVQRLYMAVLPLNKNGATNSANL